jgi:hypothetical protein
MRERGYLIYFLGTKGPSAGVAVESRLKAGCSQDWLPHKRMLT